MTLVLCVTPNIALDRALLVPGFQPGGVWRAEEVAITAGGKGLNVARALGRLGQPARVAGLLGGRTGDRVAAIAEAGGVTARWTRISGETRTCIIIADGHGGSSVVNEPGPTIEADDWGRFANDVKKLAADASAVAISGSLPPGVPHAGMRMLIEAATAVPVWVDSSGVALTDAIAAGVYGIKVNAAEASAAVGRIVASADDALAAASSLRRKGIGRVAITLGADGAVLVDDRAAWHAAPPVVGVRNGVGGGDCFLAGLLTALVRGDGPETALRLATACGSANAATLAVGDIDPAFVNDLLPLIALRRLDLPRA